MTLSTVVSGCLRHDTLTHPLPRLKIPTADEIASRPYCRSCGRRSKTEVVPTKALALAGGQAGRAVTLIPDAAAARRFLTNACAADSVIYTCRSQRLGSHPLCPWGKPGSGWLRRPSSKGASMRRATLLLGAATFLYATAAA